MTPRAMPPRDRPQFSRRRVLVLTAGLAAMLLAPGASLARATAGVTRWRGTALGSAASITLAHPDGRRILADVLAEIARLDAVFSLHRSDSALSRLNRDGVLVAPPFDLVECLGIAGSLHHLTDGLFDPTVQPVWAAYAEAYAAGRSPTPDEIRAARARTGWSRLTVDGDRIALDRGMALTLNGIAQGFIADKVATLLMAEGLDDVMIDTGELRALGGHPEGGDWPVLLAGDRSRVPLRDRALATSAPRGTTFDQTGAVGHIIDPRSGTPGGVWTQISVTAPSAAVADGLSTAFCLMARPRITAVLAQVPDVALIAAD